MLKGGQTNRPKGVKTTGPVGPPAKLRIIWTPFMEEKTLILFKSLTCGEVGGGVHMASNLTFP